MEDERRRLSRRDFVAGALVGTAGLWIEAAIPRPLAAAEAATDETPRSLTSSEWAAVEAISARILPTDDTPGAIEAGCVNFIDKALAHEDAAALPLYRAALRELDRCCGTLDRAQNPVPKTNSTEHRREVSFVDLSADAQDEMLGRIETGEIEGWRASEADARAFFQTVRMHTILGFVLDPSHGGNRDHVGWKTMGFPGVVHHLGGSRAEQMRGDAEFVPVWERTSRARQGHDEH